MLVALNHFGPRGGKVLEVVCVLRREESVGVSSSTLSSRGKRRRCRRAASVVALLAGKQAISRSRRRDAGGRARARTRASNSSASSCRRGPRSQTRINPRTRRCEEKRRALLELLEGAAVAIDGSRRQTVQPLRARHDRTRRRALASPRRRPHAKQNERRTREARDDSGRVAVDSPPRVRGRALPRRRVAVVLRITPRDAIVCFV